MFARVSGVISTKYTAKRYGGWNGAAYASARRNGRFVTGEALRIVGEGMEEQLEEIKRIGRELCAAGIPFERALEAVKAAYEKEAKV